MGKVALLFPGQGAQYVGMGTDFIDYSPIAGDVFKTASETLGYDLKTLCALGPEEELKLTEITQPAILAVSYIIFENFKRLGIKYEAMAGLSLGEYTALVASGSIDFRQCIDIVRNRGKFMQEAVPVGRGTMAAILGLTTFEVETICKEVSNYGIVEPANYNSPGQIVIAGEVKAVEMAVEKAKEMGSKKSAVLKVSAPFHCSMLRPAGEKLSHTLKHTVFNEPEVTLISNVDSKPVSKEIIKDNLIKQVSAPVLWQQSIEKLIHDGFDTFIELGPGKALSGFNKRINKEIKSISIEKVADFEKLIKEL